MNITALLPPEAIVVRADVQTKEAAIDPVSYTHLDVYKRQVAAQTVVGIVAGV